MPTTPKHPADQVYDKMLEIFGTSGNQIFTMEWPARVLDETTYAYDVSSVYSGLTKPQPVTEAEFRLSNGLLDVSPIVAGPNGKQLSTSYETALNRFTPGYPEAQVQYQSDKETLRAWLLEEVSGEYLDDSKTMQPMKGSRIEIYTILNQRYLDAVSAWDESKTARMEAAQGAGDGALDEYARWLAETAPAVEAGLEAKFADLLVKGYYHEIRSALATLDVESVGESLEKAKTSMRASGMSSLDETETIYPVQFQPQDWFKGLSTDFQSEDLLMDPMALQSELLQKQQQIAQLQEQYTFLQSGHTGDEADLQEKADACRNVLDTALSGLTQIYGENTITVARMYFASTKEKDADKTGLDAALEKSGVEKKDPLSDTQWNELKSGMAAVSTAQQNLTAAGRNLVTVQVAEATAKTTDNKQLMEQLQTQMAQLQSQVQSLQLTLFSAQGQAKMAALNSATDGTVTYTTETAPDAAGKLTNYPLLPTPMPAPGQFFDVVFHFTEDSSNTTSSAQAASSQSSYDVDLFFGSASGSTQNTEGSAASSFDVRHCDIQIGFRVMKVTMDRGGWFDPTVFDDTSDLAHLPATYTPVSSGAPKVSGYLDANAAKEFAATAAAQILPAYPVSFIVAKDVTIVLNDSTATDATVASAASAATSNSGGCFCFSVSSSSASSSSSHSAVSSSIGKNMIIKIPGPQILGWFSEYIPADVSERYNGMPTGFIPTKPAASTPAAPHLEFAGPPQLRGLIPSAAPGELPAMAEGEMESALRAEISSLILQTEGAQPAAPSGNSPANTHSAPGVTNLGVANGAVASRA